MIQRRAKFHIKPTISARLSTNNNNNISSTPIQSPVKNEPITAKNNQLKEILIDNNSESSIVNDLEDGNNNMANILVLENNNPIEKKIDKINTNNIQRRLPIKPKVQTKVLKKVTFQNSTINDPNINSQVVLMENDIIEQSNNGKSNEIQTYISNKFINNSISTYVEKNLNQNLEKDLLENQEEILKCNTQVNTIDDVVPNNIESFKDLRQSSQFIEKEQAIDNLNNTIDHCLDEGNYLKSVKIIDKIIARKSKPRQKTRITETVNDPIDPSKVSMADMIYLNPSANPMRKDGNESKISKKNGKIQEDLKVEEISEDDEEPEVIPQVRIGPDGNIVLNEASMIIEEKIKKAPKLELVDETHIYRSGYSRKCRTKVWSIEETKRFYAALSMIGTDFSFMCRLFPKRKRVDLKKKFKREEKHNRVLIEAALRERKPLNIFLLAENIPEEENKATKKDVKKIQHEELEPILSPPVINMQNIEKKKRLKRKHYFYEVSDDEYEPPLNVNKLANFYNSSISNLLPLTRRIKKKNSHYDSYDSEEENNLANDCTNLTMFENGNKKESGNDIQTKSGTIVSVKDQDDLLPNGVKLLPGQKIVTLIGEASNGEKEMHFFVVPEDASQESIQDQLMNIINCQNSVGQLITSSEQYNEIFNNFVNTDTVNNNNIGHLENHLVNNSKTLIDDLNSEIINDEQILNNNLPMCDEVLNVSDLTAYLSGEPNSFIDLNDNEDDLDINEVVSSENQEIDKNLTTDNIAVCGKIKKFKKNLKYMLHSTIIPCRNPSSNVSLNEHINNENDVNDCKAKESYTIVQQDDGTLLIEQSNIMA